MIKIIYTTTLIFWCVSSDSSDIDVLESFQDEILVDDGNLKLIFFGDSYFDAGMVHVCKLVRNKLYTFFELARML